MKYLFFILPFIASCQSKAYESENLKTEFSVYSKIMCSNEMWQYSTSFNEEIGLGIVSINSNSFITQNSKNSIDTFPLPGNEYSNFFNIIPNQKGEYYFLSSELGLYKLDGKKPVFIDSICNNNILKSNGLKTHFTLNIFKTAHFISETELLIPIHWDYYNQTGKYKNNQKPCPQFCVFNLKTLELYLVNSFTDKLRLKNRYLKMGINEVFSCVNKNVLLVSVPYKSSIEVFDLQKNKSLKFISVKSEFQLDSILPYNKKRFKKVINPEERYSIESGGYGPIYFNSFKNEYYRIYYHPLPRKNSKEEYTIINDRASSIIVLDEEFNVKKEIIFRKNAFILLGLTVTKNGFILNSQTTFENEKCSLLEYFTD